MRKEFFLSVGFPFAACVFFCGTAVGRLKACAIFHSHFSSVLCRFAGREHIILNNCRCKAKAASQGQTVRCGQAEFKTIGYVILNGVKNLDL